MSGRLAYDDGELRLVLDGAAYSIGTVRSVRRGDSVTLIVEVEIPIARTKALRLVDATWCESKAGEVER